jgi:hypothetical protein
MPRGADRIGAMKRIWIVVGALAVTLGTLALAFWLGAASFDARRYDQHRRRLAKVMREQPTADRLTRGMEAEGSRLVATAATPEEKERVAAARGGPLAAEIRQKAARQPELRVYEAGDMLYFVYFDGEGVMRDFTCVSR